MSCSNSSSKCNPCGPSEDAINAIANRANYYARVAQYAAEQVAQFNTVYLGAKATAPTVDNSGNPLIVGALYFNSTDDALYIWDGTAWIQEVTINTAQTITGKKTFTQSIIASLQGVTNGVAAASGVVGELIESTRSVGSGMSLTSGLTSNIANITLTAGEWYINGQVDYRAGATTSITILTQGISTASGTLGAQDTFSRSVFAAVVPTAANDIGLPVRGQVLSLTATSTVYLVTNATFTVSTLSAYGTIQARRIR